MTDFQKIDNNMFEAIHCEKSFGIFIRKNKKTFQTDPYRLAKNKKICFDYDESSINGNKFEGNCSTEDNSKKRTRLNTTFRRKAVLTFATPGAKTEPIKSNEEDGKFLFNKYFRCKEFER